MQTPYVCGLLFSSDGNEPQVLLIRKQRPDWQKGLLNGIGGRVEADETPDVAMNRECEEETGLIGVAWQSAVTLTGPDYVVYFFSAEIPCDILWSAKTTTDEEVEIHSTNKLDYNEVINDLRIIIPIATNKTGILRPVYMHNTSLMTTKDTLQAD